MQKRKEKEAAIAKFDLVPERMREMLEGKLADVKIGGNKPTAIAELTQAARDFKESLNEAVWAQRLIDEIQANRRWLESPFCKYVMPALAGIAGAAWMLTIGPLVAPTATAYSITSGAALLLMGAPLVTNHMRADRSSCAQKRIDEELPKIYPEKNGMADAISRVERVAFEANRDGNRRELVAYKAKVVRTTAEYTIDFSARCVERLENEFDEFVLETASLVWKNARDANSKRGASK